MFMTLTLKINFLKLHISNKVYIIIIIIIIVVVVDDDVVVIASYQWQC